MLTVTPNALSLLGEASVGSGATVTFPEGSLFGEATVVANAHFTISEQAGFSLYGVFTGNGTGLDHHLTAALHKAGEATPTAAIGYFQDGTFHLPTNPITGLIEPGDYYFSLTLWSKSTGDPSEEGQTVSRIYSGGVSNLAFTVLEIPEPTTSLVAAGAIIAISARRRRPASTRFRTDPAHS